MFETFTEALGLAVVHFIWQGALWGVLAAIALRCVRTATARYAVGLASSGDGPSGSARVMPSSYRARASS